MEINDVNFNLTKFSLSVGMFSIFYLIMIVAILFLFRFIVIKTKEKLEISINSIYVLVILPIVLNIFNLWITSGFLAISEDVKNSIYIISSTLFIFIAIRTLTKINTAISKKMGYEKVGKD